MIQLTERTYEDPAFQHLTSTLTDWINDELIEQRIIVRELDSDLYDGQVLKKLLDKLTDTKIDVPEVTISEHGQRYKLRVLLDIINKILNKDAVAEKKWTVDSIHRKDLVAILHLLVALIRHFRPAIHLPDNVTVEVMVPQRLTGGKMSERIEIVQLTEPTTDAFDSLFNGNERLVVENSLTTFINKYLAKLNLEVTDLDNQLHDGVYLILLLGLIEGFFTPLDAFHLTPNTTDQKVHNVNFAFELMNDLGVSLPTKVRPESIVRKDFKSTLKVLWALFLKYKDVTV